MRETGLKDKNGVMICEGNFISLDGNTTADNSMGFLPNGWMFGKNDIYEVYFDETVQSWSLKLGVKPNTAYNVKYMNHAISLLHGESVEIVDKPQKY